MNKTVKSSIILLAALAAAVAAPAADETGAPGIPDAKADAKTESVKATDETPSSPASASSVRDVIRQFLLKVDITYQETNESPSFTSFRYHLSPDDGRLEVYPVVVWIDEAHGLALSTAILPFTIPDEALPTIAELAAIWTKETPQGQFGVDFSTHGFFFQIKMPIEFLRMDDLASFFSFFFWPPMVIGAKDAEVRAVAAEVGPRDIGGGAESKSDAANEAEKDDGNGAAGTNEGTSAEKSTDAPPATDEALVKDSITRWLDDMGVELFFKTESPGAATYRFDMRVTDDPGPFSTVQMLLRFSGAWVYADATPRVYFPKSRRSEVMNAIAQESGRISYTSIHWSEERRCYTARAVLPASAVVRDTDSSLKWLLDRAGEAANEIGGRLAQFLTEEEPLPGVPCGTPPGSPSLLDESGRLALFAGFTQEDVAANEAERRADPEMPMTRNSLFLRVRNEDGEDAWRLLLTSGSDWRAADGMNEWCASRTRELKDRFFVSKARFSSETRYLLLVCDTHSYTYLTVCSHDLRDNVFRVLTDGDTAEEEPDGSILVRNKKTYLYDDNGVSLGAAWYDEWIAPDGTVLRKTEPTRNPGLVFGPRARRGGGGEKGAADGEGERYGEEHPDRPEDPAPEEDGKQDDGGRDAEAASHDARLDDVAEKLVRDEVEGGGPQRGRETAAVERKQDGGHGRDDRTDAGHEIEEKRDEAEQFGRIDAEKLETAPDADSGKRGN